MPRMTERKTDPHLTPDRMTTFLAVARHGSFTLAAAEVHLSQPAVSRQIAALERALGVALFERVGQGTRLTDAGLGLLPGFRRILGDLAVIHETVRSIERGSRGVLRIAASATPGLYLIPPALARFQQRHPGVDVEFHVSNTRRVEEMVIENAIDAGFVGGTVSEPSLVSERLTMDEVVCFASKRHPMARRTRITAAELGRETLVIREEGSATGRIFTSWLLSAGGRLRRTIELGCPEAIKTIVSAGLGIGCLSILGLRDELSRKGLVTLRLPGTRLHRPISTIRHPRKVLSPALHVFMETLRASVTGLRG